MIITSLDLLSVLLLTQFGMLLLFLLPGHISNSSSLSSGIFFPKLFLRLSVSLLNFLMMLLLAYSYSLPQFLWLTGAPASYSLVTPLLESFMRNELCLHQILDIDLEQDTLMFPKTLLELSVSILKYFVNRWNLCKLVYFSARWCLKFINMYVF